MSLLSKQSKQHTSRSEIITSSFHSNSGFCLVIIPSVGVPATLIQQQFKIVCFRSFFLCIVASQVHNNTQDESVPSSSAVHTAAQQDACNPGVVFQVEYYT